MGRVKEALLEADTDADTDTEELQYSLNDDDVRALLGRDTSIVLYPQLAGMQRIPFDKHGRCVVLYLTENAHTGHWTLLLLHSPAEIEYFDSFGLQPDGDAHWLSAQQRAALGESQQLIHQVLRRMKATNPALQVFYNTRDFQSKAQGVDDCGRWVCARALLQSLSLDEFAAQVDADALGLDHWVVTRIAARLGR